MSHVSLLTSKDSDSLNPFSPALPPSKGHLNFCVAFRTHPHQRNRWKPQIHSKSIQNHIPTNPRAILTELHPNPKHHQNSPISATYQAQFTSCPNPCDQLGGEVFGVSKALSGCYPPWRCLQPSLWAREKLYGPGMARKNRGASARSRRRNEWKT